MENINIGNVLLISTLIYSVLTYLIVRYAIVKASENVEEKKRKYFQDENIRILKLLRDNKINKQEFDIRLSRIPADIAYNDVL